MWHASFVWEYWYIKNESRHTHNSMRHIHMKSLILNISRFSCVASFLAVAAFCPFFFFSVCTVLLPRFVYTLTLTHCLTQTHTLPGGVGRVLLLYTAIYCNILQHTATYCNILKNTVCSWLEYGVALVSRSDKNIGRFLEKSLIKETIFCKRDL